MNSISGLHATMEDLDWNREWGSERMKKKKSFACISNRSSKRWCLITRRILEERMTFDNNVTKQLNRVAVKYAICNAIFRWNSLWNCCNDQTKNERHWNTATEEQMKTILKSMGGRMMMTTTMITSAAAVAVGKKNQPTWNVLIKCIYSLYWSQKIENKMQLSTECQMKIIVMAFDNQRQNGNDNSNPINFYVSFICEHLQRQI